MSIHFACGNCGKVFTLDDKFAGKTGKCKDCGAIMQIPAASPSANAGRAPSNMAGSPGFDAYGFDDEPAKHRAPESADDLFDPLPPRQALSGPPPDPRFQPPQKNSVRRDRQTRAKLANRSSPSSSEVFSWSVVSAES